jgi:hypothetical protein
MQAMKEGRETEGMLTDELLARAMAELEEVRSELARGDNRDEWLRECELRLDNAKRDVGVALARFRKART